MANSGLLQQVTAASVLSCVLMDTKRIAFACNEPQVSNRPALQGIVPPVQKALELYDTLSKSDTALRQPVGLEQQLLKKNDLDTEVGQSMLQLLKAR